MKSQAAFQDRVDENIVKGAVRRFLSLSIPMRKEPICDWVQSRIDLRYDHTSAASGKVRLYPYQVEPLSTTEESGVEEVSLCWAPRLGKSAIWKFAMAKRVSDGGLSALVVYPTMEMGMKINKDTVQPLLMTLPEARKDLAARGGKKKDSYHIPSCQSIIYFLGGGSQVINYTANFCVIDEADRISVVKADEEGKNTDQIKAVRIRMQTFREKMLIVCSSPTLYGAAIYEEYMKGSRGEWHLRCLNCGQLSSGKQLAYKLQDGSFAGLQWEKDDRGMVIDDSIRWVCPLCRHPHTEADAFEMNLQGAYVHLADSNRRHRSFQCSALANPWIWRWRDIAERQEGATDPDSRKDFLNNVMGMPYKHTKLADSAVTIAAALAAKQVDYPPDLQDRLSIVVAAADQQRSDLAGQKYFPWVVRGWAENGDSWLLAAGTANSLEALDAAISRSYFGHRVFLACVDQGGFDNAQDMDPFVNARPNIYYYKGEDDKTLKGRPWAPSETNPKLFLANALKYQIKLLGLLYDPPRAAGYHWQLPTDAAVDYITQVGNVGPNSRILKDSNGQLYQNWCAVGSNRRDFFDAEKMALVALDIACWYGQPVSFPKGNKPLFIRQEYLAELVRQGRIRG